MPALRLAALALVAALPLAPAVAAPRKAAAKTEEPAVSRALRERIVALLLKRSSFGGLSIIPVRFEGSRLAGPFEDGARTTYCVTARMLGRSLGAAERARAIVRLERTTDGGRLTAEAYDTETCAGQRTAAFEELDAAKN